MKNASKFNRGGCYDCCECGRKTRDTGDNGASEMCPECYERCSWENDISDNGETAENVSEVARLRDAAIAKGGVLRIPVELAAVAVACKWETVAATEVNDGDIIINMGYRCRASECRDTVTAKGVRVRNFKLTSEPSDTHKEVLPGGFNGGCYGGNQFATYGREIIAR